MKFHLNELENIAIFSGIQPKDFNAVIGCLGAYDKPFLKSEYVASEGTEFQDIGLVLSGSIHMIKEDIWGGKSLLTTIGQGKIFGESIVCGGLDSTIVSFVAAEDSTILFLPFKRVLHTCENACVFHGQLIENMVAEIAQKNVCLMEKMEITSKKTIRERVLIWLSQKLQQSVSRYVESTMGRLELADYLCVDRCALTRELARMKAEGLIDYDRNTFFLK